MDKDWAAGVSCELEAVTWRLEGFLFIDQLVDPVDRLQHIPTSMHYDCNTGCRIG